MAGERANYFFCVRVTDPEIRSGVTEALEWIVDKENQYEPFCYTPEMIHVTLCEVSLNSEEEITRASEALKKIAPTIKEMLPRSKMVIKGLTTFFEKVLVANVEYEDDFKYFVDNFKERVRMEGVNVVEKHEFSPHMTILKVNTAKARKAKAGNINPWLYVNLKHQQFGQQAVDNIHLCQMGYARRSDGFYHTPAEHIFQSQR